VRKPPHLLYGTADVPPPGVTVLSGVQQGALVAINLVYPLLICREAGVPAPVVLEVLSVSMLVVGLATALQAWPGRLVGSGLLCPIVPSAIYLAPSLQAARVGGLPLVFGMTVLAGLAEVLLARVVRSLRPLLPPELTGFVVALLALTAGSVGIRYVLGLGRSEPGHPADLLVAGIGLGTMIALNVWGRGFPRLLCVLFGMGAGYGAALALGRLTVADLGAVAAAPLARRPQAGHLGWAVDSALLIPFGIAALAATLKTIGNLTTCQSQADADWTRPDFRSISGGVLADGLGSVAAGALGTMGMNTGSGNVGLIRATGVASRTVAYAVGALFLVLAFLPKAIAVLALMPAPVMGAALLFSSAFFLVNGLQLVTSRMLDARKTLVIGLGFMAGLAVDFYPAYFGGLPPLVRPFASSSLVFGTLVAVTLNLVFRLGVRRSQVLVVDPGSLTGGELAEFMEVQGAAWGARRDVIDRASFNLQQSIETIVESCEPKGPLTVEASFDEFRLDVRVTYEGAPLELPERRPTNEEIMESDEGQRRLAGFMLRRLADRVQAQHRAGRATILFHFDH
jgi:xanthine permease XanP